MISRLFDSAVFAAVVFGWNFVAFAAYPMGSWAPWNAAGAALTLVFVARNTQAGAP